MGYSAVLNPHAAILLKVHASEDTAVLGLHADSGRVVGHPGTIPRGPLIGCEAGRSKPSRLYNGCVRCGSPKLWPTVKSMT